MSEVEAKSSGLEGIVVADTAISHVDGERGQLVIAGSNVEKLPATTSYEGAAAMVLQAGASGASGWSDAELRPDLARARGAAWEILPRLGNALDATDGMEALRAAMAHVWAAGGAVPANARD